MAMTLLVIMKLHVSDATLKLQSSDNEENRNNEVICDNAVLTGDTLL